MLPRFILLAIIGLLATATFTFAAEKQITSTPVAQPAPAAPPVLVVPDVERQAYVFAKGILQDAGFAWKVDGPVRGYAANTVAVQQPAPGTRVRDTGAPLVVLRLAANGHYDQHGLPEDASPDQVRTTIAGLHGYWRRVARSPLSEPPLARAADVLLRTCEGLAATLGPQPPAPAPRPGWAEEKTVETAPIEG